MPRIDLTEPERLALAFVTDQELQMTSHPRMRAALERLIARLTASDTELDLSD
jgi:hypothetical protein